MHQGLRIQGMLGVLHHCDKCMRKNIKGGTVYFEMTVSQISVLGWTETVILGPVVRQNAVAGGHRGAKLLVSWQPEAEKEKSQKGRDWGKNHPSKACPP